MFRGDARHTAVYNTKGLRKLRGVKWKFQSGSGISSAAAVTGGRVIFGNWKGIVFALDDDLVLSIKAFDPNTQRTQDELAAVHGHTGQPLVVDLRVAVAFVAPHDVHA